MRIVRIVQVATLVVIGAYGVVIHNANPEPLALPGLLSLPAALVLLVVAVASFAAGWIPATVRAWRRSREVVRLERRVAELEQHVPSYDRTPAAPVIPDRVAPAEDERGLEDVRS